MRHPIGAEPLRDLVKKGDKVCLVVADITRAWNRASEFTDHVVNELNDAGIPDDDIYIVFAQGTLASTPTRKTSPAWARKSLPALKCTSTSPPTNPC